MLNLVKHEFLKSRNMLIITSAIFAVLEIAFIISGFSGMNGVFIASSILIVVFISFIAFAYLIYAVMLYDMDISHKHKNGYMLFMTPNSTYKIIGSKLIAGTVVEIVFGIIISLIFVMDIKLSFKFTDIAFADNMFSQFGSLTTALSDIKFSVIVLAYLNTFAEFTCIVSVIYLARMLYDTILHNVKAGGVIAFAGFIVINIIFNLISSGVMKIFDINMFTKNTIIYDSTAFNAGDAMLVYLGGYSGLIIPLILNLVFIAVSYIATCILCDKKLNL